MGSQFPRLYAITDAGTSGFAHRDQVARLIAGGARMIQIRDKDCTPDELYRTAVSCIAVARPLGAKIIINDRADVALAAGADGVHLGQEDLPAQQARALLGTAKIIGVSTHTFEQAIGASSLPVDYVAVGPVFSTSTKSNPEPVVGLALITEVSATIKKPIIAIGGITLDRARSVIEAGAQSVAVISDLYQSGDIAARTAEFITTLAG